MAAKYSYIDYPNGKPRVRWTNRQTGSEHSMTFEAVKSAYELVGYLEHYSGEIDRSDPVIATGAYRNGFPEPGLKSDFKKTFGDFAMEELQRRLARRRINDRTFEIRYGEVERTRIPTASGLVLRDVALADVNREMIEDFEIALCRFRQKTGKPYASNTVRQTMMFVTSVVKLGISKDLIPPRILANYKLPEARRLQPKRALEHSDYLGLRKHETDRQVRLMLDFLAGTGCRMGEMIGIQIADIQVTETTATVMIHMQQRQAGGRAETKNRKRRLVPITLRLGRELMKFASDANRTDGNLFRSSRSTWRCWSHQGFATRFKNLVRKAIEAGDMGWEDPDNLPTPHNLRHSYVSWALAAGISAKTISLRTGHSVNELWKTYAESLTESEDAMDAHLKRLDPWSSEAV